jgi:hypothetical protein
MEQQQKLLYAKWPKRALLQKALTGAHIVTDRIQSLTVVLDGDYRVDDAEAIIEAISMIRGVQVVATTKPIDMDDYLARARVGNEFQKEILAALDKIRNGSNDKN